MTHVCGWVGGCVHFLVECQELYYLGPGHDVSKFQKRYVIRSCTDEYLSQDDEHELAPCTVVVVMVSVWLSVPVCVQPCQSGVGACLPYDNGKSNRTAIYNPSCYRKLDQSL
jgi:hypothetical protein